MSKDALQLQINQRRILKRKAGILQKTKIMTVQDFHLSKTIKNNSIAPEDHNIGH
jgi:phosphoribosylaminoimidazole carboxylase (NCAIR synthetase)